MRRLHNYLRVIIRIQRFAKVIRHHGSFYSYHRVLIGPEIKLSGKFAPDTELNDLARIISQLNLSDLLHLPVLKLFVFDRTAKMSDAYKINSSHSSQHHKLFDTFEIERCALNRFIIFDFANFWPDVKNEGVIVFHWCIFEICHLDLPARKRVNLALV